MHLRGDLFHPRFKQETGLHELVSKGVRRLCLVEAAATSLSDYVTPTGIHRAGFITDKGVKPQRLFNVDEQKITDSMMGESAWPRPEPEAAMRRLIEARLTQAVEDMA